MADEDKRDETEEDEDHLEEEQAEDDEDDEDDETSDPRPVGRSTRASKPPEASRRNVLLALGAGLVVGAGGGVAAGHYLLPPRRRKRRPRKPLKPAYIEVADWNPRKGPNPAKVTIVEFSDYQ